MAKLIFTVTHSKSLKQNKKLILMGEKSFIYEKNFASWNKLIFYEKKKNAKKFQLQVIHHFPNQLATLPNGILEKKSFHGKDPKYFHLSSL